MKKKITPTKDEKKEFRELKEKFDSIRKEDYQKSLENWTKYFDWSKQYVLIKGKTPNPNRIENIDDKDIITILPRNEEENILFCNWYSEHYIKSFPKYNLEIQKERTEKSFSANNPIGFIEDELLTANKHIDFHFLGKEIGEGVNKRRLADSLVIRHKELFKNYDQQEIKPNWKKASIKDIEYFIQVKFYSDYRKYLKEKLEEIKAGKIYLVDEDEDLKDKHGKWNLRQRYLLLKKTDESIKLLFDGNKINQKAKEKIISTLLDCDIRTARDLLNQKRSYKFTDNDNSKVENFKTDINLD